MHHRAAKILACVMLVLVIVTGASADIGSSFDLDYSIWRASHIVLATEGQTIDGKLAVLESWKGDLKPGSHVEVSKIAEFADEQKRRIPAWWDEAQVPEPYVRSVTGSKMVLFLIKAIDVPENKDAKPGAPAWIPASHYGDAGFKVSVVWFERGEAYAFQQIMNPGPIRLHHLRTAIEVKARIATHVMIESELDMAIDRNDPILAAQALRAFDGNKFHYGTVAAIESISQMGRDALPTLRQLLRDRTLRHRHPQIISAMVDAGDEAVAGDLADIVAAELEFWSKRAADLNEGRWNAGSTGQGPYPRERYSTLVHALRSLAPLRHAGCRRVVELTRELWQSTPVLHMIGNGQVVKSCDKVLALLPKKEVGPVVP